MQVKMRTFDKHAAHLVKCAVPILSVRTTIPVPIMASVYFQGCYGQTYFGLGLVLGIRVRVSVRVGTLLGSWHCCFFCHIQILPRCFVGEMFRFSVWLGLVLGLGIERHCLQ